MQRYKNTSGTSGVVAYKNGDNYILIKFSDGETYKYSYTKPSRAAVEEMKKLAAEGAGLATYINQHVREKFEQKLPN